MCSTLCRICSLLPAFPLHLDRAPIFCSTARRPFAAHQSLHLPGIPPLSWISPPAPPPSKTHRSASRSVRAFHVSHHRDKSYIPPPASRQTQLFLGCPKGPSLVALGLSSNDNGVRVPGVWSRRGAMRCASPPSPIPHPPHSPACAAAALREGTQQLRTLPFSHPLILTPRLCCVSECVCADFCGGPRYGPALLSSFIRHSKSCRKSSKLVSSEYSMRPQTTCR